MTLPAYPAARKVAPKVAERLAGDMDAARQRGQGPDAPPPDAATIEAIIDTAFWASLRREEDYVPQISLALLPPPPRQEPARSLLLEWPLPLNPSTLARFAPAVERPGIHLGIWPVGDQLMLWGTTLTLPRFVLVVEVVAPGLLVIKYPRRGDVGKYVNIAVLEGDQINVVDQRAARLLDLPPIVTSMLSYASAESESAAADLLVQLAASMRAHGRGGALLIVPAGTEQWRASMVQPIRYGVSPPFSELAQLLRDEPVIPQKPLCRERLKRGVDSLAGLTAVDGATVINDRFEVLAFGATIGRRDNNTRVDHVVLTEPIEGSVADRVDMTQLGGTRHLSAAQFVHDQQDSIALVASQDRHFTLFTWSASEGMVHAHRIEALLL